MTEEQMQADITQWFWNDLVHERRMLFHVDNNSVNSIVGARKRALGVCKGPSDLVLVCDQGHCCFIELKTDTGVQSDEQKDFERKVKDRGHEYVIKRSVESAKSYILQKLYQYGNK